MKKYQSFLASCRPPRVGDHGLFVPYSLEDSYITGLYNSRDENGNIYAASSLNDIVYKFAGVQSFEELLNALIYVTKKDASTRGSFTLAAYEGKNVYTHMSADKVKRYVEHVIFGGKSDGL
mgnify:CR=1 FL=1